MADLACMIFAEFDDIQALACVVRVAVSGSINCGEWFPFAFDLFDTPFDRRLTLFVREQLAEMSGVCFLEGTVFSVLILRIGRLDVCDNAMLVVDKHEIGSFFHFASISSVPLSLFNDRALFEKRTRSRF